MKRKERHVSAFALCAMLLLCSGIKGSAFSLIGPINAIVADNQTPAGALTGYYTWPDPAFAFNPAIQQPPNGTLHQGYLNHYDPMGWPVPIKQFYRWNYPELWYSFDAKFIRYFGFEGVQAVHNAVEVLNDYFEPQDKSYSGVSSMNLIKEFEQHYSTWKLNPSAEVDNIYDIETLVMGLLVNHLGLGNPHRHCFTIRDIYSLTATTGNFDVAVRNYDPYNYQPTSIINGVNYSYFIRSERDAVPQVLHFDAIEYAIESDNRYTAAAGIRDIFIHGNAMAWPHNNYIPTVYGPGRYFAPDDPRDSPTVAYAPGQLHSQTNISRSPIMAPATYNKNVRSQPRHTLTFDDAGGLRYLYRTNNIVYETYAFGAAGDPVASAVHLIKAANHNPEILTTQPGRSSFPFPSQAIRPIRNLRNVNVTPASQFGQFRAQTIPPAPWPVAAANAAMVRSAWRGGIDKIKFTHVPFDSLFETTWQPQSSVWTDVVVSNVLTTDVTPANPPYFSQVVGRNVTRPDFLFSADDMGGLTAGATTMIQAPGTGAADWDTSMIGNNWGTPGQAGINLGPGVIRPPVAGSIQYIFTTRAPFIVDIWGGSGAWEEGVYRQQALGIAMQWGWVTNTGPNDYIRFPRDNLATVETIMGPAGTVAAITHLTVYDGVNEEYRSGPFKVDRSRDTVTIYGQRLDSVTSIKVLDHNTTINGAYQTLQSIDARRYIMSDQQIVLPPGILDNTTVSPVTDKYYRRISLENAKGESNSEIIYEISDGPPLITSTQYDGKALNTTKSIIIQGNGFKLSQGDVNQIWFFDDSNATNSRLEPNSGTGEFPVPLAILDIDPSKGVVTSPNGVSVDYSDIVITDSTIYIPPNLLSDGNYTFGHFGNLGGGLDVNMSRSEGNFQDATPAVNPDMWQRHIRLAYNGQPNGLPNPHVIMSPARETVQAYWAVGVGGDRAGQISGYSNIMPNITEVFTAVADANGTDVNSTWNRTNAADLLVIRGTGLDLANSIDFVDGLGNSIQTIDFAGITTNPVTGGPVNVPPWALSLRLLPAPPFGVLVRGVTVNNYPLLGPDGYEIRIDPVTFGMGVNNLWDSTNPPLYTGVLNNQNQLRRVVITTPFGTAIAPRRNAISIEP